MSRSLGTRHIVTKGNRTVGEEIRQAVECEAPARSVRAQKIFLDPLGVRADLHRVNALCKVNVVVKLKRIPTELEGRRHDDASRKSGIWADLQRAHARSGIKAKLRICRRGVDSRRTGRRCRIVTVETH